MIRHDISVIFPRRNVFIHSIQGRLIDSFFVFVYYCLLMIMQVIAMHCSCPHPSQCRFRTSHVKLREIFVLAKNR